MSVLTDEPRVVVAEYATTAFILSGSQEVRQRVLTP